MATATKAETAKANGAAPDTLTKALLAAQLEMPAITPDATNPHFQSKFVSLGNLISKVRPVLNKHGLTFAQFPSSDEHGPTLVTIIMHAGSGERLEYAAPLILVKQDPQAQGSSITYMRRYALAAALGISDQDDDDGAAASKAAEPAARKVSATTTRKGSTRAISGAQKGKVNGLCDQAELSQAEASAVRVWWTAKAGEQQFDRLPSAEASKLIEALGEDGSGAKSILVEIEQAAKDGNAVAQTLLDRINEGSDG
jgi:hypothetical protein